MTCSRNLPGMAVYSLISRACTGASPSASASRTSALIAYSLFVERWITF